MHWLGYEIDESRLENIKTRIVKSTFQFWRRSCTNFDVYTLYSYIFAFVKYFCDIPILINYIIKNESIWNQFPAHYEFGVNGKFMSTLWVSYFIKCHANVTKGDLYLGYNKFQCIISYQFSGTTIVHFFSHYHFYQTPQDAWRYAIGVV